MTPFYGWGSAASRLTVTMRRSGRIIWQSDLIWQNYHKIGKNLFPLHICRPNDYTTEINDLLQIQFYNTFTNVLSIILKGFHYYFRDL